MEPVVVFVPLDAAVRSLGALRAPGAFASSGRSPAQVPVTSAMVSGSVTTALMAPST